MSLTNRFFPFLSCLALLFFAACGNLCKRSGDERSQWDHLAICADCPSGGCQKIYLNTSNHFNGMNAELIMTAADEVFCLSVLTFAFTEIAPGRVMVEVETSEKYCDACISFLGGQKLILSDMLKEVVIQALCEGRQVTIRANRFSETLCPDGFYTKNFY